MQAGAWNPASLEHVGHCPVCAGETRTLLHDDLTDNIFFVAPGEWSLWRCVQCRSAYLDPRPDEASIGLAYGTYYTHAEPAPAPDPKGLAKLRAALGNDYRNRRYGTRLSPSIAIGRLAAALVPPLRWPADIGYRFMPRAAATKEAQMLDIGCGAGDWLRVARSAGWNISGVEPDPVSANMARNTGIEVRSALSDWQDGRSAFDFITMNHVIEHVHDPVATLAQCFVLLRPGGALFVETPNIDAIGHRLYGKNWRGLEPPRHLVLFNRRSLFDAMRSAGFAGIKYRRRFVFDEVALKSRRMVAGLDPYVESETPAMPPPPSRATRIRAALSRSQSEFLTVTAIKPR